jgi:hypothetical protein
LKNDEEYREGENFKVESRDLFKITALENERTMKNQTGWCSG